jgi:hypothetical protein
LCFFGVWLKLASRFLRDSRLLFSCQSASIDCQGVLQINDLYTESHIIEFVIVDLDFVLVKGIQLCKNCDFAH